MVDIRDYGEYPIRIKRYVFFYAIACITPRSGAANSINPSIYKFLSVCVNVLHSFRHLLAQQSMELSREIFRESRLFRFLPDLLTATREYRIYVVVAS